MFKLIRSSLIATTVAFAGVAAHAQDVIRIGVTAGPHAQIAEVAKKVAERDGLKLQIVEFQDYIQPNAALDSGDLQANSY
jgi:D-methionine transport system substrate-binding protein